MPNESKVRDFRMWEKWEKSGAIKKGAKSRTLSIGTGVRLRLDASRELVGSIIEIKPTVDQPTNVYDYSYRVQWDGEDKGQSGWMSISDFTVIP